MDLVAPLVAPALSQKPAFVTYFVARGAPRPCYIPEGFDSLPYIYITERSHHDTGPAAQRPCQSVPKRVNGPI